MEFGSIGQLNGFAGLEVMCHVCVSMQKYRVGLGQALALFNTYLIVPVCPYHLVLPLSTVLNNTPKSEVLATFIISVTIEHKKGNLLPRTYLYAYFFLVPNKCVTLGIRPRGDTYSIR